MTFPELISAPGTRRLAVALLLLLSFACALPSHAGGNTPIFLLHSYSQEYPWTKRQHEGFLRALGAAVPGTIAANVEYLDTKRVPYTAAYANFVAAHLAQKYAGLEPRLIYVTDDNALLFALSHLARIFPKAPIFFSGINDYGMKARIDPRRVSGVFENKQIAPNLELMRHLAPQERDILVVGDESETYQSIRREVIAELVRQPNIQAHFVSSSRIDQLSAALRGRKERFVFLTTLGAVTDGAGNALTLPETIAAIVQAGQFVVISMEDVYLYPGVLGGYVTSGYKQGAAAAELGAYYLAGTEVAAIKPIETSPNEYIFDGAELQKLGLTLPPDIAARATIVNPLPTFFERHQAFIVPSLYAFALSLSALLTAFLYALLRKNRQIARTSKDLAAQSALIVEVKENLVRAQHIAGIGSWEWTPAADAITWSDGLYAILRRDPALGPPTFKTLQQFYTTESWERLGAAVARTIENGTPYELELEMIRGDATTLWTSTRGEAVRGADGTVVKLRGTVHDIDARKRADWALRESEAQLRSVLGSTIDGILAVDRDRQVIQANQRFAQLWRIPQTLLESKDDKAMLDHVVRELADPEAFVKKVEELYHSEVEATDTIGFKDGRVFERFTAPLILNRAVVGRVWSFRDITENRRAEAARASLEAQLRESQKMESLGTLAGGVAHDFNNALAAIAGNVELARQDVGPAHPALVSLEEIDKAGRRAKDLVQQILAFGRRQKLERKATALALVVVESARLIRATLPASVSLIVDCQADAPAVLADATQVKQILLNVCANALHAIEDQARPGVIEIRLTAYDCQQSETHADRRPGRYACLTLRDNGSGMDAATRARAFDPFYTTKPVGKGTGLGLAVVYGIVRAHEASIEVESSPGVGTTFRIYFPETNLPLEAVTAPAADAAAVPGQGKHILYVDDEEAIIFLMTRLLQRQGYRVSGYTDPREALAAVRADPAQFDLAVTDYNMPGMSGLDVAKALKVIRPDLPVLLASGYITEELRALAPAAGVRELVYKPNTVDDLCAAVARFANAQGGSRSSP